MTDTAAAALDRVSRPVGPAAVGVTEGLFFSRPDVLPRGPHALSRDRVLSAQRERLMRAMTELVASAGYEAVRIGDVTTRAGVSRAAFYACFSDKLDCASAAYDRYVEVAQDRVSAALDPTRPVTSYVQDALTAFLSLLQSDLVVARAFLVESDAMGPRLRVRRRQSMQLFAALLASRHDALLLADPTLPRWPGTVFLGIVYAVRQLAADALESSDEPDLLTLVPDISSWLLRLLRDQRSSDQR